METKNYEYDATILLRVFPGLSKPNPLGFTDKYLLVEYCLESLVLSIQNFQIDLKVFLDSCPKIYEDLFRNLPDNIHVEIEKFRTLGNVGSFEKQLETAGKLPDSRIVLFLEDDYFWSEDGFTRLINFASSMNGFSFATPYNHPDYLELPVHQLKNKNETYLNWLEGISTTCTFMARAEAIKSCSKVFGKYGQLGDFGVWLCLTRHGLTPRKKIFSRNAKQKELGIVTFTLKAWLSFLKDGLWKSPKAILYYPKISCATHMDSNYLGLGQKWPF